MLIKRCSFAVLVIAGIALLLLATRMDYVPTVEQVKIHPVVAPFLVEAKGIKGIYGNMDVDSIVFRYTTGTQDVGDAIRERAKGSGWSLIGELRFERIEPLSISGSEEVRFRLDGNEVTVAWVQGDTAGDAMSFSETPESKWAQENVWWRLEE